MNIFFLELFVSLSDKVCLCLCPLFGNIKGVWHDPGLIYGAVEEKEGKASTWPYVQLVIRSCLQEDLLKKEIAMFSFEENTRRHNKSPNYNLRSFVEFLYQWIYALFCPAPPRTAPRIFTLAPPHPAPPRGFLPLPRPAPPRRKMLRPAHPWWPQMQHFNQISYLCWKSASVCRKKNSTK